MFEITCWNSCNSSFPSKLPSSIFAATILPPINDESFILDIFSRVGGTIGLFGGIGGGTPRLMAGMAGFFFIVGCDMVAVATLVIGEFIACDEFVPDVGTADALDSFLGAT